MIRSTAVQKRVRAEGRVTESEVGTRPTLLSLNWLAGLSKPQSVALAIALGLLAALCDMVTGSELSFSIFYVAPVAIVTWRCGHRLGVVAAGIAAVTWFGVEMIGDRAYSQALIPVWNGLVRLGFFVLVVELLGGLNRALQENSEQARIDELTGLANRRGYIELGERELARSARTKEPISVAYFDLDKFKILNDTQGHAAGDEVLRRVGEKVHQNVRPTDIAGRLGGDEFALVLPGADQEQSRVVVERLRVSFADITRDTGVGFSCGVLTFYSPPADIETALEQVDEVMYQAKTNRRGSVVYALGGATLSP